MRLRTLVVAIPLTLALLAGQAALGQSASTGALTGTVLDSSGAVVSKATITVTNAGTGARRVLESDARGVYRIPLLEPGSYDIEAGAASFRTERKRSVTVSVAETQTLNFVLKPGEQAEVVNVEANTALVQTETITQGGLVDRKTVESLPLSTRNYTQILNLSPGVQADVNNAGNIGRKQYRR